MIPRAQRTCLSCIYGGDIIGNAIECRRTHQYVGHLVTWWCGEGQWEEIVPRMKEYTSFRVYSYADRPTPETEEMW